MSLVEEQFYFLQDVAKLINFITDQGYVVTGGELWRPIQMQRIYVRIGRSKTMKSYHLRRLAIDLNFFKPVKKPEGSGIVKIGDKYYKLTWSYEDIKPFGEYWESLNPKNVWGGNFKTFKDVPHFERRV